MRTHPEIVRSDVRHFDKKGFVPSRKVATIDDYLREAEAKSALLGAFLAAPQRVVADRLGVNADFEVAIASAATRKRFFEAFDTEAYPAILATPPAYRRLFNKAGDMRWNRFNPLAILNRIGQRVTILKLENGLINIPILKKQKNQRDSTLQYLIRHETVHAIRAQHESPWERVRYHSVEEIVAITEGSGRFREQTMLRAGTPMYVPWKSPYLIVGGGFYGGDLAAGIRDGNRSEKHTSELQ